MDKKHGPCLEVGYSDLLAKVTNNATAAVGAAALEVCTIRYDVFPRLVLCLPPHIFGAKWILVVDTLHTSGARFGRLLLRYRWLLEIGDVSAFSRTQGAELTDAVVASLLGELGHPFGELEIKLLLGRIGFL